MDALAQLEQEGIVAPDVDGAELLDELVRFFKRFIVFESEQAPVALALWVAHCHVFDAAQYTPYIVIWSPEPESGKSRVLEVMAVLVPKPWLMTEPSEAVLFRKIDKHQPTVLLDEFESIFSKTEHEGMRALLCTGFRRGATVPRCVPPSFEVKDFGVFAPKALAGTGRLPDALETRKIPIRLKRKTRDEHVERFREALVGEDVGRLRERLEAWGSAHVGILAEASPKLPEALTDRQQDIWEPLLAVAESAGEEWARRAREAAEALHGHREDETSNGVLLLSHIRAALLGSERITTKDLLAYLVEQDDGPWAIWWNKDIKDGNTRGPAARLAKMLRPYGIKSKSIWTDEEKSAKGFEPGQFEDAWFRYLPSPRSGESGESGESAGSSNQEPHHSPESHHYEESNGHVQDDEALAAVTSLLGAEPVNPLGRCQFCQQESVGLEDLGKLGMACEDCEEQWRPEMEQWSRWNRRWNSQ
jgi:hypothetical protein